MKIIYCMQGFTSATRDHFVVSYFPTAVFTIVNILIPLTIYQVHFTSLGLYNTIHLALCSDIMVLILIKTYEHEL